MKSHHWFQIEGSFANRANRLLQSRHTFLSWCTSLLCFVVELAGGGYAFNGASFFILFFYLDVARIYNYIHHLPLDSKD